MITQAQDSLQGEEKRKWNLFRETSPVFSLEFLVYMQILWNTLCKNVMNRFFFKKNKFILWLMLYFVENQKLLQIIVLFVSFKSEYWRHFTALIYVIKGKCLNKYI